MNTILIIILIVIIAIGLSSLYAFIKHSYKKVENAYQKDKKEALIEILEYQTCCVCKKKIILDETQEFEPMREEIIRKQNGDFFHISCGYDMM